MNDEIFNLPLPLFWVGYKLLFYDTHKDLIQLFMMHFGAANSSDVLSFIQYFNTLSSVQFTFSDHFFQGNVNMATNDSCVKYCWIRPQVFPYLDYVLPYMAICNPNTVIYIPYLIYSAVLVLSHLFEILRAQVLFSFACAGQIRHTTQNSLLDRMFLHVMYFSFFFKLSLYPIISALCTDF